MNKIYIIASSYQVAREFCANQEPEINPRGKNVRILLRPESTFGIVLDKSDKVFFVSRPTDSWDQYSKTQEAWKIVKLTSESRE